MQLILVVPPELHAGKGKPSFNPIWTGLFAGYSPGVGAKNPLKNPETKKNGYQPHFLQVTTKKQPKTTCDVLGISILV